MKLFNGQLVVIVRSKKQPGTLTLKVRAKNGKLRGVTSVVSG